MKPYLKNVNNVLMIINETTLLVVAIIFYAFVEPSSQQKTNEILGNVVIVLIIADIMLNIVVLAIMKVRMVYIEIKEFIKSRGKSKTNIEEIQRKRVFIQQNFIQKSPGSELKTTKSSILRNTNDQLVKTIAPSNPQVVSSLNQTEMDISRLMNQYKPTIIKQKKL
mmetsp:Transcript_975/g.850  ORF Transcript_975/g.850 Transcript_975/m.850 type:complete len:166 (-) Transcript_975:39-536(-)